MREILFRGKSLETGEWVYGGYSKYDVRYLSEGPVINENDGCENIVCPSIINYDDDCLWVRVDPKTVGQYVGIKDKEGKPIFEGDVVEVVIFGDLTAKGQIAYGHDGAPRIYINDKDITGRLHMLHPVISIFDVMNICIIGNAIDNPELMEV